MANQELSQELAALFAAAIQNKLSNLCALISLAEKQLFSKPTLFGIQNAVLSIHSIAKTYEQGWVSEIFETQLVRPLQAALENQSIPGAQETEMFRQAVRQCQERVNDICIKARAQNIAQLSETLCGENPDYSNLLSALGQIGIWGYHEIMGELTKVHAYSEMIQNWIDDLKANPIAGNLGAEIQELSRIQVRMRDASDLILEIIRRSRAARGRIKQNREILLLSQLSAMMMEIRSVKQDAKWLVGNMPAVDVVIDKHQFEFIWTSIEKLFLDWLSPTLKIRALCDAGIQATADQKIALYMAMEPQSDMSMQTDFSTVIFSKDCPMHDVGKVFEACNTLAKMWEIEIDLGLNSRGYPVARFLLPLGGKQNIGTSSPCDNEKENDRPITLIVDDDKDIAVMLQKKLARFGFPAIVATDLESARLVLTNQRIGAILSDLFIGEESGLDLLTTVKKQYPNLKFIFMTGATSDDVSPAVAKLLAAHADAALSKPIDDTTLRTTLESLMPS